MVQLRKKARYGRELREKIELLRSEGKTYTEIRNEFSIPKSTLSAWLGKKYPDIFDKKAQALHLKRARVLSAESLNKRSAARNLIAQKHATETASALPFSDISFLKSLLAMLYWAEGTKFEGVNSMKFVNTDPRLLKLYLTLLRRCFPIDEKRVRIRVHIHHYHDKKKVVRFWSKLLKVPDDQFGKLYIKKRSDTKKFRKNFMGICFIAYSDVHIFREIMALGPMIQNIITSNHPLAGNRTQITNSASSRSIR